MVSFAQVACSIATFVGLSLTGPVAAAEPEACPGLIASRDALFSQAALRQDEVGLTFIGHATFLLEFRGRVETRLLNMDADRCLRVP